MHSVGESHFRLEDKRIQNEVFLMQDFPRRNVKEISKDCPLSKLLLRLFFLIRRKALYSIKAGCRIVAHDLSRILRVEDGLVIPPCMLGKFCLPDAPHLLYFRFPPSVALNQLKAALRPDHWLCVHHDNSHHLLQIKSAILGLLHIEGVI